VKRISDVPLDLDSVSRNNLRLTAEEFASLKEVGNRPMQRTISDEHRGRLLKAGLIREIARFNGAWVATTGTGK